MCKPAQRLLLGPQQTVSLQAPVRMNLYWMEDKQMVMSKDGRRGYTVFDKVAVRICVEETFGHRRHLQLMLVDPSTLPVSEQMS